MPAPMDTEEQLRTWLKFLPDQHFDFIVESVPSGGFKGLIYEKGNLAGGRQSEVCTTLPECLKQLWKLKDSCTP